MVKHLLNADADPNISFDDEYALELAAEVGNECVIKLLLSHGGVPHNTLGDYEPPRNPASANELRFEQQHQRKRRKVRRSDDAYEITALAPAAEIFQVLRRVFSPLKLTACVVEMKEARL